jgi:uncharacterized delta-60 repeat protein
MPTDTKYGLSAYSVELASDGKIIVAGYSLDTSTPNFAVARLNSDGSLDTSFGSNGKVITSFNSGPDIGRRSIYFNE